MYQAARETIVAPTVTPILRLPRSVVRGQKEVRGNAGGRSVVREGLTGPTNRNPSGTRILRVSGSGQGAEERHVSVGSLKYTTNPVSTIIGHRLLQGSPLSDPMGEENSHGQETMRYRMCVASGVSITRTISNSTLSGITSNSRRPLPNSTGT